MLLPNFAEIKIPFQDRAETIGILGENDEFLRVLMIVLPVVLLVEVQIYQSMVKKEK